MMKKNKAVPRVVNVADAAFIYISTCCTASAKKPACAVDKGQIVGVYLGAKPEGESSLGSWRCSACGKPCKVTRTNKPQQEGVHE
jgi:hypothetical protein